MKMTKKKYYYQDLRIEDLPGEVWKKCVDFPLYEVSNYGRIKRREYDRFLFMYGGKQNGAPAISHYCQKIIVQSIGGNGYLKVSIRKDGKTYSVLVHRLVALAFIKNPLNLPQVNHKDEDKLNNCAANLEWNTEKQNSNYGTRTQRMSKTKTGVKRGKMSDEQKQKISIACKGINAKKVYCGGMVFDSLRETANYFKTNYSTLRNWINGYNPMPPEWKDKGLKYI